MTAASGSRSIDLEQMYLLRNPVNLYMKLEDDSGTHSSKSVIRLRSEREQVSVTCLVQARHERNKQLQDRNGERSNS